MVSNVALELVFGCSPTLGGRNLVFTGGVHLLLLLYRSRTEGKLQKRLMMGGLNLGPSVDIALDEVLVKHDDVRHAGRPLCTVELNVGGCASGGASHYDFLAPAAKRAARN